ncbi:hypothetical protein D3C87_460190 [compost metagenome]
MSYFGTPVYPVAPVSTSATVVNISANTTLGAGAATFGKDFVIQDPGSFTITLPAVDINLLGQKFTIFNACTSAVNTLNAAGSDVVRYFGANSTSVLIQPGSKAVFEVIASGTWAVAFESGAYTISAPQFDNGPRIANTAFVQRALGNFQAVTTVSSATTLTAAQTGSFILASLTGYTITLPAPVLGLTFTIYAGGANSAITIATPSGNIFLNGNGLTSRVIPSNVTWQLVCLGTDWVVASQGLGQAALAVPGYQKLPSGLILQWGTATATTGGTAILYPYAFSTLYTVNLSTHNANSIVTVSSGNATASGFTAYGAATATATWIATGI